MRRESCVACQTAVRPLPGEADLAMRVLVIGAGAIGGWLAGVLSRGGAEVALVARGAALEAIRAQGLALIEGDRRSAHGIFGDARLAELLATLSLIHI